MSHLKADMVPLLFFSFSTSRWELQADLKRPRQKHLKQRWNRGVPRNITLSFLQTSQHLLIFFCVSHAQPDMVAFMTVKRYHVGVLENRHGYCDSVEGLTEFHKALTPMALV